MILTGEKAVEALSHLLKPEGPREVIVMHKGKRYGGFRDEAHAGFFIRINGWENKATIQLTKSAK
jgi:hypothetical protein